MTPLHKKKERSLKLHIGTYLYSCMAQTHFVGAFKEFSCSCKTNYN